MSPVPDDVYIQEMHQLVVQELDQAKDLVSRIKASFQGRNEKRGACVVCTERSSITSLCTARMKRAQTSDMLGCLHAPDRARGLSPQVLQFP